MSNIAEGLNEAEQANSDTSWRPQKDLREKYGHNCTLRLISST